MATVKLIRGDTWIRTWVLKDSSGAPVDLSGASARLMVRDSNTGAVKIVASTDNGFLTIIPTEGRIDLIVPYTQTETLTPGKYKFDLEVTYANNIRRTIEQSILSIVEDVTR